MVVRRNDTVQYCDEDPWVHWVTFPCEFTAEVILVLDASASAQPYWEKICVLARGLMAALPRELTCVVYFLGNPSPHDADDFTRSAANWYRANQGRASLIGPVLESVTAREGASVLVLGEGRIFDLEDWRDTPVLGRTRLAHFGDAPLCDTFLCRQDPAENLNPLGLAVELDHRPSRVQLSARRAMPFIWDNFAYVWDEKERCLTADKATDFRVRVGLLCDSPEEIRPTAVQADCGCETLSWRSCDAVPAGDWVELPPREADLFRQCVHSGKYICPHCRDGEHPAARLRCTRRRGQASILGLPIYQVLDELQGNSSGKGFALFRDFGERVCLRHHSCAALRLPNRAVGVRQGADVSVYRFDPAAREWRSCPDEHLRPYHLIGEHTHAVVL